MNHKIFSALILMLGIVLVVNAVQTDNVELDKIATRLFGIGLVAIVATLYEEFWISRKCDVDAKIFSDPRAAATYVSGVWIALAIAGALGF